MNPFEPRQDADSGGSENVAGDIGRRSVRGGAVTLATQGVRFLTQLSSAVILGRLLLPADYGLVAMVSPIIAFIALFNTCGLSMATVQRAELTHAQVSTVFWVNVAISTVLMALTAVSAPAVAWFYAEPRLTGIVMVLATTLFSAGLSVQHRALLSRQMRFTALSAVDVFSLLLGVSAAIAAATAGMGYWSLVVQPVVSNFSGTLLVWILNDWRPGRPRRGSGAKSMVLFGAHLTAFDLVNFFARNADNVLIGWAHGPGALGFYAKAYQMLLLPISQIKGPLTTVALPALSRLKDNPAEYSRYYYRMMNVMTWLTAPGIAVLAACSEDITVFVLGDRWRPAGRLFTLLAPVALFQPLYSTIGWVFMSQGRGDRMLRWTLVNTPLMIAAFGVGLPFGAQGVAVAYSTLFAILLPWTFSYTFRGTALTVRGLLASIAPPATVGVLVFFAAVIARISAPQDPLILRLLVEFGGAAIAAVLAVLVIPACRSDFAAVLRATRHLAPSSRRRTSNTTA